MYLLFIIFWLTSLTSRVTGLDPSLISPCPTSFIYRFEDYSKNTWYGTLFIPSESDSYTVRTIRILLDSEAESLQLYKHKSSRATVDTFDFTEFLIENLEEKIRKGDTSSVTIAVKKRRGAVAPKLTAFRVNEVTICPAPTATPTSNQIAKPSTSTNSGGSSSGSSAGNELVWTSRPSVVNPSSSSVPFPSGNEACGTRVQEVTPLIINGRPSRRGQWPWHGALYAVELKGPQYRCGATLISKRHVITAAHCVCVSIRSKEALEAQKLLLVFGRMHLSQWHAEGSQDIQAESVVIHPEYNNTNFRNDLAVIKLVQEVKITPWVRIICLWPDFEDPSIKILTRRNGTIVGWGFTSKGTVSEVLLHAEVPVIEPFACAATNPLFYWRYLSEKSFCAGVLGSTSACNGDSGGGMAFRKAGSDIWQLRGVVSLAALDRDTNTCDINQYAVFTDVARYLPWIHQQTRG